MSFMFISVTVTQILSGLTSAKNASILPTPPWRLAPGPAERRHRLRSRVRKSHQLKSEPVCRDEGKVAVPLCWCFPFNERLFYNLRNSPISQTHLSCVHALCAKKTTHEKIPRRLRGKNEKCPRQGSVGRTLIEAPRFSRSAWFVYQRMCVDICVCMCARVRMWVSYMGLREDQSGGRMSLTLSTRTHRWGGADTAPSDIKHTL